MSSFVIFWLTPPLPIRWWRHLWTAPYWLFVVCPASVTSPLISTIRCFRPYKPYIFCEDMIMAACHCHSLLSWARFTVVLFLVYNDLASSVEFWIDGNCYAAWFGLNIAANNLILKSGAREYSTEFSQMLLQQGQLLTVWCKKRFPLLLLGWIPPFIDIGDWLDFSVFGHRGPLLHSK